MLLASEGLRNKIGLSVVLRGFALGGRAVVGIVFARALGASEVGLLFLAMSIANLVALFARRGLDRLALSEVARRPHEARAIAGELLRRILSGSVISCLLGAGGFAVAGTIFDFRTSVFVWALLASVPINISQVTAHVLRGEQRILGSLLTGVLLAPPLRLVLFFALFGGTSAEQASLAFFVGWVMTAVVGVLLTQPQASGASTMEVADGNLPLHRDAVNTQLVDTLSTVAMSLIGVPSDVGAFSVSNRIERATLLPTIGTRFATAPRLAVGDEGDVGRAVSTAVRTARKSIILQAPVVALSFALAPWFLAQLGEGFERGTTWLRILLLASLVNAVTGSTTQILLLGPHRDELARSSRLALVMFLVGSVVLVPFFGPLGIVIAVATAKVGRETIEWKVVRDKLGVRTDVLSAPI